jgi:hypothetical protein
VDLLNIEHTEPGNRQDKTKNGFKKKFRELVCVLCCAPLFVSCGIENYVYLEPVEYVMSVGSTSARITIPNNNSDPNFRYYAIFYRIYISGQSIDGITTSEQRRTINSALESHYNAINPYTINDNISPSSVGTVFSSQKYYSLYVQIGSNPEYYPMSQILTPDPIPALQPIANNNTVEIVFANTGPYLKINYSSGNSGELPLRRSADQFTARPDRRFANTTGSGSLSDTSIISENSNADVEKNSSSSGQYAYASLYVVAAGIDSNFTAVYSRPKHIGVFRLP